MRAPAIVSSVLLGAAALLLGNALPAGRSCSAQVVPSNGATPAPAAVDPATVDSAIGLRRSWVLHRIDGDLEAAVLGYTRVAESLQTTVDLRARARIGLAILARDQNDVPTARDHRDKFSNSKASRLAGTMRHGS